MKTALNIILLINTIYVLIISENPNVTEFFFPASIYLVFGFLRWHHVEFLEYLNNPKKYENEDQDHI